MFACRFLKMANYPVGTLELARAVVQPDEPGACCWYLNDYAVFACHNREYAAWPSNPNWLNYENHACSDNPGRTQQLRQRI